MCADASLPHLKRTDIFPASSHFYAVMVTVCDMSVQECFADFCWHLRQVICPRRA